MVSVAPFPKRSSTASFVRCTCLAEDSMGIGLELFSIEERTCDTIFLMSFSFIISPLVILTGNFFAENDVHAAAEAVESLNYIGTRHLVISHKCGDCGKLGFSDECSQRIERNANRTHCIIGYRVLYAENFC